MRKAIYQIDNLPEHGYGNSTRGLKTSEAQRSYTMPSVERYASRIGADYIVIKSLPPEAERIKHHYSKSVFSKIFLFRRLLESNYDKFLFIDCDFFAEDAAHDIFEDHEYGSSDFCICRSHPPREALCREHAERLFGEQINNFYNSGFFLSNRSAAYKINKAIPEAVVQGTYPTHGEKWLYNEAFFGYVLYKSKIQPYILDRSWNCKWDNNRKIPMPQRIKMTHYIGNPGKLKIIELDKNRQ